MKQKAARFLFVLIIISCPVSLLYAWGFWAHLRINRAAVFALPEEMRAFYYNHIDFITEEAAIPDVRIYANNDKAEVNRHYIDLEHYQKSPADSLPRTLHALQQKYDEAFLKDAGILPWYIDTVMTKLTMYMKERNKPYILFLSADLAHYIGDAHVPLHTTENHDGQLTGQKGIHALWESLLPEKYGDAYNLHTEAATYIPDVHKEIWQIINHSHKLVDTLLMAQKKLNADFPADKVYLKDAAGNTVKNRYNQPVYSGEYTRKYHDMLQGMNGNQMRLAIHAVANFWYTAWVNAGKPSLLDLDNPSLTKRNAKNYRKDLKLWKTGKLFGIKSTEY